MKRFLKKRCHSIPVGIITAVLVLGLVAGGVLAANGYIFFSGSVDVEVREAIAVGAFGTWDNLHPYGSDTEAVWVDTGSGAGELGDVIISIVPDGDDACTLTIEKLGSGDTVGTGFVASEWIVIPVNLRNGSSGALTLRAEADGTPLELDYLWKSNTGTDPDEDGCDFGFMPTGTWEPLNGWTATIDGYEGESGSAKIGALVLFVRITAPGNIAPNEPGTCYNITFALTRQ